MTAPPEVPVMPVARDGIYPRCVWCRRENYVLSVLAYSAGLIPCAVDSCGKYVPEEYIKRKEGK